MDFEQKLKRFVELKKNHNSSADFNNNEYEALNQYLSNIYLELRLITGIDPGNQFNFDAWVEKEYKQMVDIEKLLSNIDDLSNSNSSQESELEMHMQSFDNLNFNNQKVYDWHESILKELENNGYKMSTFYFTDENKNNKILMEEIILKRETYNFLNSKNLFNTGICPITGENINNTIYYEIYNRKVYLSHKGSEVCKQIDRNEWNLGKSSVDYDTFQDLKQQSAKNTNSQVKLIMLLILILSFSISWLIVSPSSVLSFLGFLVLGVIFFYIFGWLFNLLFPMFYK